MPPEMLARMGVDPAHPGPALEQAAASSPRMHWALGAGAASGCNGSEELRRRYADIACPTLLTTAEDDAFSQGAAALLAEAHLPEDPPPLHRGGGRRRALRDG